MNLVEISFADEQALNKPVQACYKGSLTVFCKLWSLPEKIESTKQVSVAILLKTS